MVIKLVTSPYFKKRRCASSIPHDSNKNDVLEESLRNQDDTSFFSDPLFCFYFRSFARLYHQLLLLKPLLIQECVADDPWKVLIAVTLLNKTAGKAAIPIFWDIVARYPTPLALSQANETDLTLLIRPLGLQSIRAKRLIRLSRRYLETPPLLDRLHKSNAYINTLFPAPTVSPPNHDAQNNASPPPSPSKRHRYPPTPISHIPGTGPYALDSYRIFCTPISEPGGWKDVMPTDKELIKYLRWRWAFQERMLWTPGTGVVGHIDIKDLESLISELKK